MYFILRWNVNLGKWNQTAWIEDCSDINQAHRVRARAADHYPEETFIVVDIDLRYDPNAQPPAPNLKGV